MPLSVRVIHCGGHHRGHNGAVPLLTIQTLDGWVGMPENWLAFIARELREEDRYVVVGDGRRHCYAQAANDQGKLVLEYRDGSPQRHFQVVGMDISDVAEALAQWAEGERAFVGRHQWQRLTDWD